MFSAQTLFDFFLNALHLNWYTRQDIPIHFLKDFIVDDNATALRCHLEILSMSPSHTAPIPLPAKWGTGQDKAEECGNMCAEHWTFGHLQVNEVSMYGRAFRNWLCDGSF